MIDNTRSVLNKREVMIIAMRFVLAGHTDNTLEEAGQKFGLTGENAFAK